MLLPTPVPASNSSAPFPEYAWAQQYAIFSCSGRCSKFGNMPAYPPLSKIFSQSSGSFVESNILAPSDTL